MSGRESKPREHPVIFQNLGADRGGEPTKKTEGKQFKREPEGRCPEAEDREGFREEATTNGKQNKEKPRAPKGK